MRIEFWTTYGYLKHEGTDIISIRYCDNRKYRFVNETTGVESKEYHVIFGNVRKFKLKLYMEMITKLFNYRADKFSKSQNTNEIPSE